MGNSNRRKRVAKVCWEENVPSTFVCGQCTQRSACIHCAWRLPNTCPLCRFEGSSHLQPPRGRGRGILNHTKDTCLVGAMLSGCTLIFACIVHKKMYLGRFPPSTKGSFATRFLLFEFPHLGFKFIRLGIIIANLCLFSMYHLR